MYAPTFVADYIQRFGKPAKCDFDAHRGLREGEELRTISTVRVLRKVTISLTVKYDQVMYLLDDTPENRGLNHTDIDLFEFSNGDIEIQSNGSRWKRHPSPKRQDTSLCLSSIRESESR